MAITGFPFDYDCMGNLTSLTVLYLNNNTQLSGTLPNSFLNLAGLRVVQLSSALSLSGTLPMGFGPDYSLGVLTLSGSKVSGTLPDSFWFSHIFTGSVTIFNNLLSGTFPNAAPGQSYCQGLQLLDMGRNYISGTLPPGFGNRTWGALKLSDNRLSGKVPIR